jgi:hypothetical protein
MEQAKCRPMQNRKDETGQDRTGLTSGGKTLQNDPHGMIYFLHCNLILIHGCHESDINGR